MENYLDAMVTSTSAYQAGYPRGTRDREADKLRVFVVVVVTVLFCFIVLFRAIPTAHGSSQARGRNGAIAANLHQSHSSMGSELRLQPTP